LSILECDGLYVLVKLNFLLLQKFKGPSTEYIKAKKDEANALKKAVNKALKKDKY
jgi:hypothetical protein